MDWEISRIVASVEDAFGFAIPDDDAARFNTVGDLHDYVLVHRFHGDHDDRLASIAFYKVRRALTSILKTSRDSVRDSSKLTTLISRRRRRIWRAIEKQTGFHLPILRRPHRIVMLATMASIGLGIWAPLAFGLKPLRRANVAAIFAIAAFGYLFFWLTEFLATQLPPDVATVGQLAKATLARNYQPILAEARKLATDDEVWDTLRRIVSERLAVPYNEIAAEMELSRHLVAN